MIHSDCQNANFCCFYNTADSIKWSIMEKVIFRNWLATLFLSANWWCTLVCLFCPQFILTGTTYITSLVLRLFNILHIGPTLNHLSDLLVWLWRQHNWCTPSWNCDLERSKTKRWFETKTNWMSPQINLARPNRQLFSLKNVKRDYRFFRLHALNEDIGPMVAQQKHSGVFF